MSVGVWSIKAIFQVIQIFVGIKSCFQSDEFSVL